MNIHEYQAKEILKFFKAPVPKGVLILKLNEIEEKIKKLDKKNLVIKAQIHAGGRGKAGGIALVKNKNDLLKYSRSAQRKKDMENTQPILKKIQEFVSSGIEWIPTNKISLNEEKARCVLDFLEKLENDDDVQHVYANLKINNNSVEKIST